MKYLMVCLMLGSIGCATTGKFDENCKSWLGKNSDELISSWGVPTRQTDLSDGAKMLEYSYDAGTIATSNNYFPTPYSTPSYSAHNRSCRANFTVRNGIVSAYNWEGHCRSK